MGAASTGQPRSSLHGFWSSRLAFILAVTGSAVGLGNIWKFPYIAGENGGGAFVLIYLACVFAIGLPIMMSETLLGRRGRRNPMASMALLGEEEGGSASWGLVGLSGVFAGFLILLFTDIPGNLSIAFSDFFTPVGIPYKVFSVIGLLILVYSVAYLVFERKGGLVASGPYRFVGFGGERRK